MKRKPITNEEVGARVRTARLKAGLTQEQLGEKIERTGQSVAKYEKGLDAIPIVILHNIALVLKCQTTDLLP